MSREVGKAWREVKVNLWPKRKRVEKGTSKLERGKKGDTRASALKEHGG